jgi:predicted RecA/RadA family phage recombinase
MSNLTVDKADGRQEGVLFEAPIAASTKIFKGSNVAYNTAGYAVKGADTASFAFAGVAMETIDNSAGAAGDRNVRCWREGIFDMNCASATQAWVGQLVYLVDDNLVALAATTTNDVPVGKVVWFTSATSVRVKI